MMFMPNCELMLKIAAAKRALSLAGKLKPSPFRAKYTRRALINLNKLRASL